MQNNVTLARAYYQAMSEKNLSALEKFLHPDASVLSPLGSVKGKPAVLNSAKHFMNLFNTLTIRAAMGAGDQVMLAADLDCPQPVGLFKAAMLVTCKEGLIYSVELFYDARPLVQKKDELFNH